MKTQAPRLDNRTSSDIYRQAIAAAKVFCPEWIKPDAGENYFNPGDSGLVILKLLSRLTESTLAQLNRVPDKHKLAFYDLLGIDLLPARASAAPLTFNLGKGSTGALVKKGSQVASKDNDKVVFETTEDLFVLPAFITDSFSFDPWRDRYTAHVGLESKSESWHSLMGYDKNEKKCSHRLLIRNDILFNVEEKTALTVTLEFAPEISANQVASLFRMWRHENNGETVAKQEAIQNVLTNTISLSRCEAAEMDDAEHWISVSPDTPVEMIQWAGKIPQINAITMSYANEPVLPGLLFCDNIPLEAEKGFYPFQKKPETRNAFYISSQNVFKKIDADVTIEISCDPVILSSTDPAPALAWEFWNGKNWEALAVTDTTGMFTKTGAVSFKMPDIKVSKVNGKEERWIRARITSGGYGQEGCYEAVNTTPVSYIFKPPTFTPPFIHKISLGYVYKNIQPQEIRIENYLEEHNVDQTKPFTPYVLKSSAYPAFYFALNDAFRGKPLSFYFIQEKRLFNEQWSRLKKTDALPESLVKGSLEWQYYNGQKWCKIESYRDETIFLTDHGILNLLVPGDISQTRVFGKTRYWLRLAVVSGSVVEAPRIKGIFPNTVNAVNHVEIKGEVAGSSNGKPGQFFTLSKTPVLEGQIIEVVEPETPSKEEVDELEKEGETSPVTRITDDHGNLVEVNVRWREVGDFTLSGPKSRHYKINRVLGIITFGDGKNGLIPPKGMGNIIARNYKSGGGRNGNVPAGTITSLKKTIANIESAVNICESSGGSEQETLAELVARGPHAVKTKKCAVTTEDFEWLAREADPAVYRSRCLRSPEGKIQVIILPKGEESSPLPTAQMIKNIREYLVKHSLFTIGQDIEASGPAYKVIDIKARFKPESISEVMQVQEAVVNEMDSFFHSIKGNTDAKGWDFGQALYSSDLSARLEGVKGVDYIKNITMSYIDDDGSTIRHVSGIGKILAAENEIISRGKLEAIAEA